MPQTTKPQESDFTREDAIALVNQAMLKNGLKPLTVVEPEKPKQPLLEIVGIAFQDGNLMLALYSPHADIQPYDVLVQRTEDDYTVRRAGDVKHTDHTKPVIVDVHNMPFDKEVLVTVSSIGKPDYVATTKFTRHRDEDTPVEPDVKPEPPTEYPPKDEGDQTSPETPIKPGEGIVIPRIGMNTTGYGYAPEQEFGINQEWIERMQLLANEKAIDWVRIHVRWEDWEPNIGEFTEVEMIRAIKKIRSIGCAPAFCIRPYRRDDVIAYEELAMDHAGRKFDDAGYHTFAPGAETAQNHFRKSMVRLAQLVNMYAPEAEFTSLGYGITEEYFLPCTYSETNGQDISVLSGMCIFSEADKRVFRAENGSDIPVYDLGWFPDSIDRLYRDHPRVLDYITGRMAKIQREFNAAWQQNSKIPVCGYYADVPSKQSAWYGHRDLLTIFAGCDMMYSTDGGSWEKFLAADLHRGTWPNKPSLIELDPEDSGRNAQAQIDGTGPYAYDGSIQPHLVKQIIEEVVRRGATHIPLAMAYGPHQIAQIGPILREIRKNGIKVEAYTGNIPEVEYGSQLHSDQTLFRDAWEKRGGREIGHPAPFKIVRHKSQS